MITTLRIIQLISSNDFLIIFKKEGDLELLKVAYQ